MVLVDDEEDVKSQSDAVIRHQNNRAAKELFGDVDDIEILEVNRNRKRLRQSSFLGSDYEDDDNNEDDNDSNDLMDDTDIDTDNNSEGSNDMVVNEEDMVDEKVDQRDPEPLAVNANDQNFERPSVDKLLQPHNGSFSVYNTELGELVKKLQVDYEAPNAIVALYKQIDILYEFVGGDAFRDVSRNVGTYIKIMDTIFTPDLSVPNSEILGDYQELYRAAVRLTTTINSIQRTRPGEVPDSDIYANRACDTLERLNCLYAMRHSIGRVDSAFHPDFTQYFSMYRSGNFRAVDFDSYTPYAKTLHTIYDLAVSQNARHYQGYAYVPKYIVVGGEMIDGKLVGGKKTFAHTFEQVQGDVDGIKRPLSIFEFVMQAVDNGSRPDGATNIDTPSIRQACDFISERNTSMFPKLSVRQDCFAFKNGVFNGLTEQYLPFGDENIPRDLVCYNYYDVDFPVEVYKKCNSKFFLPNNADIKTDADLGDLTQLPDNYWARVFDGSAWERVFKSQYPFTQAEQDALPSAVRCRKFCHV